MCGSSRGKTTSHTQDIQVYNTPVTFRIECRPRGTAPPQRDALLVRLSNDGFDYEICYRARS
jgi:hypothetical protein